MLIVIINWNVSHLLREELHQDFSFGLGDPMVLFLLVEIHKLFAPVLPKLSQEHFNHVLIRTLFYRFLVHLISILRENLTDLALVRSIG